MTGPRLLGAMVLALLWLAPASSSAHGFRPGVLTLTEGDDGTYAVAWTPPMDTQSPDAEVHAEFPAVCARYDDRIDCGPEGLRGEIDFPGLADQRAPVAVLVEPLAGPPVEAMVRPSTPRVSIRGTGPRDWSAWIRLGAAHIFGGLDHIAFVLGLLLVLGARDVRRLVATITAFTLAHSLTLLLAATGSITLRAAPVEAAIAVSVLLVAREATHTGDTVTRRAPWAIALLFGLVHGLGFAGALTSAGLPSDGLGWRLLCFNVGIELGQLAIVLPVLALVRLAPAWTGRARVPACYTLGAAAGWWFVERTVVIVTGP